MLVVTASGFMLKGQFMFLMVSCYFTHLTLCEKVNLCLVDSYVADITVKLLVTKLSSHASIVLNVKGKGGQRGHPFHGGRSRG